MCPIRSSCHADPASQAALASLLLDQAGAAAGAHTLLQAITHSRSPAPPPPDWAAQILRRAGGNPLFVIELAHRWSPQGDRAGVDHLRPLLSASLQACAPAALQLAAVAAVAGEHFSVELAAAVTGASALALTPCGSLRAGRHHGPSGADRRAIWRRLAPISGFRRCNRPQRHRVDPACRRWRAPRSADPGCAPCQHSQDNHGSRPIGPHASDGPRTPPAAVHSPQTRGAGVRSSRPFT